ncbi:hypothetical protein BDW75DRAFT_251828 [Aspergillus navahoensis]
MHVPTSTPANQPSANGQLPESVIVIGAGPVGLMIALKLATAGIAVDVIEKNTKLSHQPRAVGYHGAALAALKRTPVYEEAIKLGFFGKGICWRKPLIEDGEGGMKMGEIIASLPFPSNEETGDGHGNSVLYLPQPQLAQLFYKAALQTAWNTGGKLETFEGAFLVGADGGKSATRKILNIPFKGHSWPERIVAIDAGKKTLYRCSVAVDPNDTRTDEELVSESNLMLLLNILAPGPRPLDLRILNASAYRTHQLCASTMRRGRCLLAGDAAHLNNPFGALGLTTGLLDADALADALDMIINEKKSIDLLDIYSDERRRVFQNFVDPMSSQNKLRCANEPETATEDWLLRAMIKKTPEIIEAFGRPFFDFWPTDMRKLVASRG